MLEPTKTLSLSANVEATFNFTGNDPNVIELKNPGATSIFVLLDQTVAVSDTDAFEIKANSRFIIKCDGCTILHAISAADGTLVINSLRDFIPLQITTLVADTEKVLTFNGYGKKISLTNRDASDDAYFAFDKDAAKGTGTEELLAAGSNIEIDDIWFNSLHLISAGTPVIEVRAWEEKNG